jgi:hypothetical protein
MCQPVDTYTWRNAIMSEDGPSNPLARLVLMAISLHMKSDGTGAWPAQTLIAQRAHVGVRSVKRHLEIAERHGWIERELIRRSQGRNWYYTYYLACVPESVYAKLPERPWETDPMFRQGARAAPTQQGATVAPTRVKRSGVTDAYKVPTLHDKVPHSPRQGANGDSDEVPQWHTNSSSRNSSYNSSKEGAASAAPLSVRGFFEKTKTQEEEAAEAEERRTQEAHERIRRIRDSLPQYASEPETLAKLAHCKLSDVQWVLDHDF